MELKDAVEMVTNIVNSVVALITAYILLKDRKKEKPAKSKRSQRRKK